MRDFMRDLMLEIVAGTMLVALGAGLMWVFGGVGLDEVDPLLAYGLGAVAISVPAIVIVERRRRRRR